MKRIAMMTLVWGVSVLMLGLIAYISGARINTTRSIAVGLYWMSHDPVEKDAYVLFCPPQADVFDDAKNRGYIGAGFCPGGYGYMMKRILAAKNDRVMISEAGVFVNDALLPLSIPIKADRAGRSLPRIQANRTLDDSELLLMSDVSALSFDGRYFGPINRSQIKGVIRPVFTW